jgi:hypothetical protein
MSEYRSTGAAPLADLPSPVPVKDAIRNTGRSIEIPQGAIDWFGPFDSCADVYRIAEVTRFEDLQELGLVPAGLSERELADALAADETVYLEAQQRTQAERHHCSCQNAGSRPAEPRRRGRQHTNLASLLRASYPRAHANDDPGVPHVYHHLRRWFSKPVRFLMGVASVENIIILSDGTLVMAPAVDVVHANLIQLSSGSRLRFESGAVNVRCETLSCPSDDVEPPPPVHVPETWLHIDRPPRRPPLRLGKYLRGYSREFSSQ